MAVIPPKRNRKVQREYDKDLYKLRHLVENAFLYLLSVGEGLPLVMPKMPLRFWPLSISAVLLSLFLTRDDTI